MNRSIISNEMCLPQGEVEGELRQVTIGTLSILERLGNPLVGTLIGVGDAKFTDSVENLLELFYIHSLNDDELYQVVQMMYTDPTEIKKAAIMWGRDMSMNEIANNLNRLINQQEMIEGSMVEGVKKKAKSSKKG